MTIIALAAFVSSYTPLKRPSSPATGFINIVTYGTFNGASQLGRFLGLVRPNRDLDVRWLSHFNRAQKNREMLRLEPSYRQLKLALRIADRFSTNDPRHRQTLWQAAEVARELARYKEAEHYVTRYVRETIAVKGPTLEIARAKNMIASIRLQQAIYSQSGVGQLIDETERLLKECTGPLHEERATIHHNRAMIHHYRKEFKQAQRLYLLALTIRQQTLGEDSPITAETYGDLGLLYAERGDRRGQPLVERAIEIYRKKFGDNHPWVGWYSAQLGYVNLRLGKVDEARRKLRQAVRSRRPSLGRKHKLVQRAKCYLKVAKRMSKR